MALLFISFELQVLGWSLKDLLLILLSIIVLFYILLILLSIIILLSFTSISRS